MSDLTDSEYQVITAVKLFANSINAKSGVVANLTPLIEATSKVPLSNMEQWERRIRNEFDLAMAASSRSTWEKLFGSALKQHPLTWIDIISSDGYKREKTLMAIQAPVPNAFFFVLVLRRLNDWVTEVRKAAQEKIPILAKHSNLNQVTDAVFFILRHFSSWGRAEEIDKLVLFEIISEKELVDVMKEKIISSSTGPMSFILSQLGRTSKFDSSLYEIAEKAIQPSVRSRAFRYLFESKMTWVEGRKRERNEFAYSRRKIKPVVKERLIEVKTPFIELLTKSSQDKSSIVRRVSAELLIREMNSLGKDSIKFAELFAKDKSQAVAERGEFALKQIIKLNI